MKKASAKSPAITVGIPVRTYLKKFLHWNLNLPTSEAIDIVHYGNDPLVKVIAGSLVGKLDIEQFYSHDDESPEDGYYDEEIKIVINPRKFHYQRLHLNRDTSRFLDNYLYSAFHSHMQVLIRAHAYTKLFNEKTCIEIMCQLTDINEDDISFDALKKASYRLRNLKKIDNFR